MKSRNAATVLVLLCCMNLAVAQNNSPAPVTDLIAEANNALTPAGAPTAAEPLKTIPYFPNKTKIAVCVSDWTPAVYCLNATDSSEYTGFEVELFRKIMPYMGWTDDMMEWKCMGWDDMMEDLFNGTTCDLAPTGMTPSVERQDQGLRFSTTSLRSGFSIMVSRVEQPPGPWYFLSAMSGEVWAIMILTGFGAGLIVWLFEVGVQALNNDTKWMSNVIWDTIGRPVQMRDYRLSSMPANTLAITWSFAVYILMAMYTANLTANLTLSQIKNDIHGLRDLPGKAVGSWSDYAADMRKYNLAITGFPWDNADDELKMIDALKSGFISALVMPDQTLSLRDAVDCGTMIVGNQFAYTDEAHAFPAVTVANAPDLILEYDQALQQLLMDGALEDLQNRFIKVPQATCKTSSVSENEASKVQWGEVYGLWIMLAGAAGLGLIMVGCYWLFKWCIPLIEKKGWARVGCCHRNNALSRSYTHLVRVGRKQPRTKTTIEAQVFGHEKDDDELWDDRYEGAGEGYLDGSADVRDVEAHFARGDALTGVVTAPRQAASLRRSDTAAERRSAQITGPPGSLRHAAGFEAFVLDQLVEIRRTQEVALARMEAAVNRHVNDRDDMEKSNPTNNV